MSGDLLIRWLLVHISLSNKFAYHLYRRCYSAGVCQLRCLLKVDVVMTAAKLNLQALISLQTSDLRSRLLGARIGRKALSCGHCLHLFLARL